MLFDGARLTIFYGLNISHNSSVAKSIASLFVQAKKRGREGERERGGREGWGRPERWRQIRGFVDDHYRWDEILSTAWEAQRREQRLRGRAEAVEVLLKICVEGWWISSEEWREERRPRPYVRTAGKKSEEKAGEIDESRSRRKLLRTETDETVRIVWLMKQNMRRDERVKIRGTRAREFFSRRWKKRSIFIRFKKL